MSIKILFLGKSRGKKKKDCCTAEWTIGAAITCPELSAQKSKLFPLFNPKERKKKFTSRRKFHISLLSSSGVGRRAKAEEKKKVN